MKAYGDRGRGGSPRLEALEFKDVQTRKTMPRVLCVRYSVARRGAPSWKPPKKKTLRGAVDQPPNNPPPSPLCHPVPQYLPPKWNKFPIFLIMP